jgi:hypothetical protein
MTGQKEELRGLVYFYSETGTEGGSWAFQDSRFIFPPTQEFPEGQWSYEGLHILEDGDYLTIYSKDNPAEIVWSGKISLRKHPSFAKSVFGLWIHADQKGVDRKTWARWFVEEYPAKLIPA